MSRPAVSRDLFKSAARAFNQRLQAARNQSEVVEAVWDIPKILVAAADEAESGQSATFSGESRLGATSGRRRRVRSSGGARSAYRRLADVHGFVLDMNGEKCFDHRYSSLIEEFKETDWRSSAGVGGRQWTYQTCTEFGW